MRAAIKAGIKFAVGTDGMHGGLAQEMQYLVDFGATTSQALMAATYHAARVCRLEESIGTLQPGKYADIIGVEGNPLKDIGALKKVKTVVSMGEIKHQANQ
jgi:imidazolonepropionase-like amidohydrolase